MLCLPPDVDDEMDGHGREAATAIMRRALALAAQDVEPSPSGVQAAVDMAFDVGPSPTSGAQKGAVDANPWAAGRLFTSYADSWAAHAPPFVSYA